MTGLETGERLQRALEKEGESVTLAKKSRYSVIMEKMSILLHLHNVGS